MHPVIKSKRGLFSPVIMVLLGVVLLLVGVLAVLLSIRGASITGARRLADSESIDFGPSYLDTVTVNTYSGDGGQAIKAYLDSKKAMTQENPSDINSSIENAVLARVRCEILSSDIATARISIAAPDLVELLERVGQNADSIEECGYLILEAIESENYQVRTTELNVRIDEFGNPSDSYAFYDAIYGGILTHLDRYFADESEGVA